MAIQIVPILKTLAPLVANASGIVASLKSAQETGDTEERLRRLEQEAIEQLPEEGLDRPFLVRQLLDVVPNPWQGMRILDETLAALRARGVGEAALYANRLDLVRAIKGDLREQINAQAEALFRDKLAAGEITLRLTASNDPQLNWKLAETLEIDVSDADRVLTRKNGEPLERSLFEKVYQRDFNELEKNAAWYLDERECVYWWHRIAVGQGSYGLQGWQRHRVYPDLLACIHATGDGKYRFTVLETKGSHLKGNDDTEYKRRLFDLLTRCMESDSTIGELEAGNPPMQFEMVLEDAWREQLAAACERGVS